MISASFLFFFISAISVVLWVICRKRVFDILSIYCAFLFLFSISSVFGLVYDPFFHVYKRVDSSVWIVHGISFSSLGILILCKDYFAVRRRPIPVLPSSLPGALFLILCLLLSTSILVTKAPGMISARSKVEMLETAGIEMVLLSSLLPVAFAYALATRRYVFAAVALSIILFLFVVGTRRPLVLAVLVLCAVLYFGKTISLISKWKAISIGVVFSVLVMAGKTFYGAVMAGGLAAVPAWLDDFDLETLMKGAEFLNTSAILQEVIVTDFNIPCWVPLAGLLSFLPVPLSQYGLSSSLFNDLFQPELFPSIKYGMAYNPWAEAFSAWGWAGILVYSIFLPGIMVAFEGVYHRYRQSPVGAIFLVMSLLGAFWMHRNSMGSLFAYFRNAFYPSFIIYFISLLLFALCAVFMGRKFR